MNKYILGGIACSAWVFLLFIAGRAVWRRLKRSLFFRSAVYRRERENLRGFAERLDGLLKSPDPVGQAGIRAFLNECKTCVDYFQGMEWSKAEGSFLQKYLLLTEAETKLLEHDTAILLPWQGKLKAFAERFQSLLGSPDPIGESNIREFVESGTNVVRFFTKDPAWLDGNQDRWSFDLFPHANDILLQHDAEIRFAATVATPLQTWLSGPDCITPDQWQLLCDKYQDLAGRLLRFKPYTRPGTKADMALFNDGGNRITEHNRQIEAEIRFEKTFTAPFNALLSGERYIAHSQWTSLCRTGQPQALNLMHTTLLRPGTGNGLQLLDTAQQRVEQCNSAFVEREAGRCASFFNTLAKYPLDQQQRRCCIVDEDAALVIAGAGSGKTSVIMAKVAYLMEKRGVRPEEIRLITFTNKAAQEMAKRIADCIGAWRVKGMAISTFHKFGINILKLSGKAIADDDFLEHVIHEVMTGKADFVDDDYSLLVEFAELHFSQEELEGAFASESGKPPRIGGSKIITLAGERVKSQEELLIANFLFLKGILYDYEKPYPKAYERDPGRKEYRPDFYLPDYDIYLEHYGVDENGEPAPWWPKIEKEKYKDGMEWKRHLHAGAGNRYVESFSWWHHKGVLLDNLTQKLKALGVEFKPRPPKEVLGILWKNEEKKLDSLEKLLATFIRLYKSNHYPEEHFDTLIAQTVAQNRRQQSFLELARRVYRLYETKLAEAHQYDFSDLINRATDAVRGMPSGALPYKYVIVDEYQDATVAQMKLLQAVLDNTGAHLFCVGDDWQSIYRFAGSDLSLFTDFGHYFGDASIKMRIENTYRNSQELIDIMSLFVRRNPEQLPKELTSTLHCENPVQVVWYAGQDKAAEALDQTIETISAELEGEAGTVLLLGRYARDEKIVRDSSILVGKGRIGEYSAPQYPKLRFQFLTVHKSKGLEADYVILLNAKDDILGFPTRMADDPVLQLVQHGHETFEFAEERRLFYVALTRTKKRAFILAPVRDYSPFVLEMTGIIGQAPPPPEEEKVAATVTCPKCRSGFLIPRQGPRGWFTTCSNAPECDWTAPGRIGPDTPRCPQCGGFLVERQGKLPQPHIFLGCTNYPYCKHTASLTDQPNSLSPGDMSPLSRLP